MAAAVVLRVVALLIMIAGALSWMIGLSLLISRLKRLIRASQLNAMSIFSGVLLILYGVSAWYAAVRLVMG